MNERLDLFEQAKLYLPKHLSPSKQRDLWNELEAFPNNKTLYSEAIDPSILLQGDGHRGFVAIDFASQERKTVSGVILSNSCDIDPANERHLSANVVFAPLIKLSSYEGLLEAAGCSAQQRESVAIDIRRQHVSSLMYFPGSGELPERVALFGDVRSHPLGDFLARDRSLLFRLNDIGFYLFLFKLSIHFNRMMEGVER